MGSLHTSRETLRRRMLEVYDLYGECRRHAPIGALRVTLHDHEEIRAKWPVTDYNDGCGDFELRHVLATRDSENDPTGAPAGGE